MQLGLNLGFSPARRHSGYGNRIAGGAQPIPRPRLLWAFTENTTGKTLAVNYLNFTGNLSIDWGDGTIDQYEPEADFEKVLGNSQGIILYSTGSLLNFVSDYSQDSVGGNVDVSAFPNLIELVINNSSLSSLTGYETNSNLRFLRFENNTESTTITLPSSLSSMTSLEQFSCSTSNITDTLPSLNGLANLFSFSVNNNNFTGAIPSLTGLTALQYFQCHSNQLIGSIPSLSGLTQLQVFFCYSNLLTGSIPSLSGLNSLREFDCSANRLTGSIPSLSGLITLEEFRCHNQTGATKLTGSIPSLSGLTQLQVFSCYTNQLTGSIPSLSGLNSLRDFYCFTNQLTGSIPSLSGLTNLRDFRCQTNQLTGSIPSLSGLTNLQLFNCANQAGATKLTGFDGGSVSVTLENFQAQNNELTSTAVNAILSAFVAAGRTSANGGCILNLGGTANAAPTGQGLTDKSTLISRGWTVTTK